MLATPISRSGVNPGACVPLARKQATCGSPMPTTTTSRSLSSRAPAAAMISVARISTISISQRRIGLELFELRRAADLLEILAMVARAANVARDVIADLIRALGMLDIELQMRGVVIVAAEDGRRMRAEGTMHDRVHAMRRDDGAFGRTLDVFRRNDFFGDDD